MSTLDEKRFYVSVRRSAIRVGLNPGRLENAVDDGWPDVLLRGQDDLHIWVELKIAKGPNARIKVRPTQINWAEEHAGRGGIVHILAWNSRDKTQFWHVEAGDFRDCSRNGCLSQKCYAMSQMSRLFRQWIGDDVNLQPQDPTLAESRSWVGTKAKRVVIERTKLSHVRSARLHHSSDYSRPHYSESPWGESRR
jgi:hypothetical protein